MNTIAVRRARELQGAVRTWLEGLFGRPLDPDEEVTVMAFPPHPPTKGDERQAAVTRMERFLATSAQHTQDAPADEFDAAVDDAMRHVRKRTP